MYTFDELIRFAHLAAASKSDGAALTARLAIHGAQLVNAVDDKGTDTQGYVALDRTVIGRRVIVAFRGTTDWRDVQTDSEAWLRPFTPWHDISGCAVHSGGLEAYHRIAAALRDDLARLMTDPKTPMVFIGHSLGAMLCTMGAAEASAVAGHGPLSCVTFGSPRVGDPEFAAAFDVHVPDTTRVVHAYDGVPEAPPEVMDYRHVGHEVHIGDDGRPFRRGNLFKDGWAWLTGRVWHDHHIDGYVSALTAASKLSPSPA